jgi:hypothetical protein
VLARETGAPALAWTGPAPGAGDDSLALEPRPGPGSGPRGLVRADRLQHAGLSFTLAAGFTVLSRDRRAGAAASLGLGLAKELWDARREGADGVDLVADALGVALALVTVRGGP